MTVKQIMLVCFAKRGFTLQFAFWLWIRDLFFVYAGVDRIMFVIDLSCSLKFKSFVSS